MAQSQGAGDEESLVDAFVQSMQEASGGTATIERSPQTGLAIVAALPDGVAVMGDDTSSERAFVFLDQYGEAFGITDPKMQVTVTSVQDAETDEASMDHVRLQQTHQGVPVTAGELTLHLREDRIRFVLAKTLNGLEDLDTEPALSAGEARTEVEEFLIKHFDITDAKLSPPRLEIFNRGLFEQNRSSPAATHLAWFIEATAPGLREYIWIGAGAERSGILLHFSQLTDARNRRVYTANGTASLPGTPCRFEGGGASGDTDCDLAYDYSGDTYDYFFTQHGRDSYDGNGAALISTVDYCPSATDCPYQNAYWNGGQRRMVYGDGFPAADDVVAHELTHAVTDYSADLYYYQQSGALNESFSDIFGETVDLLNASGTDTPAVRWC